MTDCIELLHGSVQQGAFLLTADIICQNVRQCYLQIEWCLHPVAGLARSDPPIERWQHHCGRICWVMKTHCCLDLSPSDWTRPLGVIYLWHHPVSENEGKSGSCSYSQIGFNLKIQWDQRYGWFQVKGFCLLQAALTIMCRKQHLWDRRASKLT